MMYNLFVSNRVQKISQIQIEYYSAINNKVSYSFITTGPTDNSKTPISFLRSKFDVPIWYSNCW